MDSKKRKSLLTLILGLLILAVTVGISYAFHKSRITKIKETGTKMITKSLVLNMEKEEFSCNNIIPGDECTLEFSITNTNSESAFYSIYMENTINEFYGEFNDLVYTLKEDGTEIVTEKVVPRSNRERQYLKMNLTIDPGETKNYHLIIKYKYLDVDQSSYKGSLFSTIVGADAIIQEEINSSDEDYLNTCSEMGVIDNLGSDCNETVREVTLIEDDKCYVKRVDNPYCDYYGKVSVKYDYYKYEYVNFENINQCNKRIVKKKSYGEEVPIYHDIYYASSEKYTNGENERYVTYCTPFKIGNGESGVRYCTGQDGQGKCITTTSDECSYNQAQKDLGITSVDYQTKVEDFMDAGSSSNWHVQTYCQTEANKINLPGSRTYYCNVNKTTLHDWYSSSTSTLSSVDDSDFICRVPTYYEYGTPTTSSTTNPQTIVFDFSSGGQSTRGVINSLYSDGNTYGICFYAKDTLNCIIDRDLQDQVYNISKVFNQEPDSVKTTFNFEKNDGTVIGTVNEYIFTKTLGACYYSYITYDEEDIPSGLYYEYDDVNHACNIKDEYIEYEYTSDIECRVTIYPKGYEKYNKIGCHKGLSWGDDDSLCYIKYDEVNDTRIASCHEYTYGDFESSGYYYTNSEYNDNY